MQVIGANNNASAAAYRNEPLGPKARLMPLPFPYPCQGVMDVKYFTTTNNLRTTKT